ncbi:GntR family transcriptional regulator [Halarcobacter anaerophilus]|uniref:GntR family transcriptional regulator n=1 Tax=Halarcobacter anaerophilus TaxID=877500 RepID=A0A4Q0Y212_9BACT|nr:GntR family transcriptional regulator [Halarcobacter anaerophilus]QDF29085.1 transcriptional regulator, GntR family (FCD domain) [Halarcobacter anaerophilus]RXJ63713.1 GntR family transcriptional regulator [Halarcobacter anaerophilus]
MPENNLSAKAYKILEELLVTLKLEPGKVYSEKELMELSGISRTPLREALLKLSNESLINIIPRRGIQISDINMTNQLAILETRKVLDRLLISRATKYATPLEKSNILEFKKYMQIAIDDKDVNEYLRVDKLLDQTIFNAARNSYAANATAPLHIRSRRFWYYFKGVDDLEFSAKNHMKLIDAIIDSNEEEALSLSDVIINNLVDVVKKYINI